jgi:hypothetical protein
MKGEKGVSGWGRERMAKVSPSQLKASVPFDLLVSIFAVLAPN